MLLALVAASAVLGPPTLPPEAPTAVEQQRAQVNWKAPTGCPDSEALEQRIRTLLGRDLEPGEIELDGSVTLAATGYALELTVAVGSTRESRQLSADACDALADAAALVAVVVLDPVAAATAIETAAAVAAAKPEPPEEKTVEPPPEAPQIESPPLPERRPEPPPPPAREPPPIGIALRVAGGGEFGAIPGGTGGFNIAPALVLPRLRAELIGAYWVGRTATVDAGAVRVHLGSVTGRVCYRLLAGPVEIPFCGGLEVGAMRGDGRSAPGSQTRHGLWFAGNIGTAVAWYFSRRVGLWVGLQGFAPIVFPRFELESPADAEVTQTVYDPTALGVRGMLGLEIRLRNTEAR